MKYTRGEKERIKGVQECNKKMKNRERRKDRSGTGRQKIKKKIYKKRQKEK